jgi:hypothetical protein
MGNLEEITFSESLKRYAVDTFAGITYFQPLLGINEYFISGMDEKEVLKSRLTGLFISLLINRPYGKFRQYWAELWDTSTESSKLRKYLVDSSALVMFQLPLYFGALKISGADNDEIIRALPIGISLGLISGRPFGWYLDKVRTFCGTKATL